MAWKNRIGLGKNDFAKRWCERLLIVLVSRVSYRPPGLDLDRKMSVALSKKESSLEIVSS